MDSKEKSINFRIIEIHTDQFALFPEVYSNEKDAKINYSIDFGIDKDNHLVAVAKTVTFVNEKEQPFVKIQVSSIFHIDESDWESLKSIEKGIIILPHNIALHFAMLNAGTLRGVLHAKTEGTIFNHFIVPPINMLSLVPKEIIFDESLKATSSK